MPGVGRAGVDAWGRSVMLDWREMAVDLDQKVAGLVRLSRDRTVCICQCGQAMREGRFRSLLTILCTQEHPVQGSIWR